MTDAVTLGEDEVTGVASGAGLDTGPDERRRRPDAGGTAWRCMLAPIRARFASSCSRNGISAVATDDDLLRRHVHVVDLVRLDVAPPRRRPARTSTFGVHELALRVDRRVGLRDDVAVLVVGREVLDLLGGDRPLTTLR